MCFLLLLCCPIRVYTTLILGEQEIEALNCCSSLYILLQQQAYTNSLPGTLLASTAQTAREDLQYSPFPVTLAMPTKYGNVASNSGPTISMPEVRLCSGLLY